MWGLVFFAAAAHALPIGAPSPAHALQAKGASLGDGEAERLIGGCRAYAHRASYTHINGRADLCNAQTPCRLCGGSCEPATLPSGMQLPRHNVPQFLGNAVWDGLARDSFGRTLAALLGDPFAFTIAPEVDALRRLLLEPSATPGDLADELAAAWSVDPRYEAAPNANGTRQNFLNAISGRRATGGGLSARTVFNSSAWRALPESAVKERLGRVLEGDVRLSPEAAMCGALFLMDAMFTLRGEQAIMDDLPSDVTDMSGIGPTTPTIFEEMMRATPSVLPGSTRDDPHNVIYTSPYQYNANGWYGGNLSLKFAPTDGGSGIDTKWAVFRGCPMGAQNASAFCAARAQHIDARRMSPACDMNQGEVRGSETWIMMPMPTPDQGEIRTPHYKAPAELLGLNWFEWPTERHCIFIEAGRPDCPQFAPSRHREDRGAYIDTQAPGGLRSVPFDYTALIRPIEWSLQRYPGSASVPMVYVLAPVTTLPAGVFGIDFDAASGGFTAAPPPPLAWGPDIRVEAENYITPDLPARTTNLVPVWGMLYPCAASNIAGGAYRNATAPEGHVDATRCEAYRLLLQHRNNTIHEPLFGYLYGATLPRQWEAELAALRVWSPRATVDLGAEAAEDATHPHGGEESAVCVLSFAAAIRLDGHCG